MNTDFEVECKLVINLNQSNAIERKQSPAPQLLDLLSAVYTTNGESIQLESIHI